MTRSPAKAGSRIASLAGNRWQYSCVEYKLSNGYPAHPELVRQVSRVYEVGSGMLPNQGKCEIGVLGALVGTPSTGVSLS